MTKLFIGHKPGVGAVVKVMAANGYDPLTTPKTAYGKFRFDSENSELGVVPFLEAFKVNLSQFPLVPGATVRRYFFPAGSNSSTCKSVIFTLASSAFPKGVTAYFQVYLWNRILGTTFPPMVDASPIKGGNIAQREYVPQSTADNGGGEFISGDPDSPPIFYTNGSEFYGYTVTGLTNGFYVGYYSLVGNTGTFAQIQAIQQRLIMAWALPANTAALPFATPKTRKVGLAQAYFSPTRACVSRPGYDARTSTRFQNILGNDMTPARIIKTGDLIITVGASKSVACGITLPSNVKVDAVVSESSDAFSTFPMLRRIYAPHAPSNHFDVKVTYTWSGQTVTFHNASVVPVRVRYVVFADDFRPPTSGGGGHVIFTGVGYSQIRRPQSKANFVFNDILLDTRWASLPIVKQGWLPVGGFTATPTGGNERYLYGARRETVSWANDGTWVPFIKYMVAYAAGTRIPARWSAPRAVIKEPFSGSAVQTNHSRTSSCCRYKKNQAFFYLNPGEHDHWVKDASSHLANKPFINSDSILLSNPLGIRYYVFAIPKSL